MNNQDELSIKRSASKLVSYIRKSNGLSSEQFSHIIGVENHLLQQIESCERSLKLEEYARLCDFAEIEYSTVLHDSVDFNNDNDNEMFKIPSELKTDQYSYYGAINLYASFFKIKLGEDKFNEFCEEENMDPLYFYNRNNSINMAFIQSMIKNLMGKGHLKTKDDMLDFAYYAAKDISKSIKSALGDISTYNKLLQIPGILQKYEKNHEYRVEKADRSRNEVHISLRPRQHIDIPTWSNDHLIGGFVENLLKESIPLTCGTNFFQSDFTRRYGRKGSKWTTFKVKIH